MSVTLRPSQESCALHLQALHEQYQTTREQCRQALAETRAQAKQHSIRARRKYGEFCRLRVQAWLGSLAQHLNAELAHVRKLLLEHYEPLLLELAFDLARRALRCELQTSTASLEARLHNVLEQFANRIESVVLHPDDATALGLNKNNSFVQISAEIERGNFRVTLPEGAIDYSPENDLEILIESLR